MIQTDDKLNERSIVAKKPKMRADTRTGLHEADSLKLGSVDDESMSSGAPASDPNKGQFVAAQQDQRRRPTNLTNSNQAPRFNVNNNTNINVNELAAEDQGIEEMEDEDDFSDDDFDDSSSSEGVTPADKTAK